jgi:hypothetical protein
MLTKIESRMEIGFSLGYDVDAIVAVVRNVRSFIRAEIRSVFVGSSGSVNRREAEVLCTWWHSHQAEVAQQNETKEEKG